MKTMDRLASASSCVVGVYLMLTACAPAKRTASPSANLGPSANASLTTGTNPNAANGPNRPPSLPSEPTNCEENPNPRPLTWIANPSAPLDSASPTVLGAPRVEASPFGPVLCFDGSDDGLVFDTNPIAGLPEFTIQVLFRPDPAGSPEAPSEQRFVHFEEGNTSSSQSRRALIETRVLGKHWYLDTYLRSTDASRTLVDAARTHPVSEWTWAALSYGNRQMRHFVNGKLELEGPIDARPLCPGRTSLGVRLNRVSWFRGCIRELRVSPQLLDASALEQLP